LKQVAGIILAAGGSTRYGQPKQLLDWNGAPLLARVADEAQAAGLSPVIVVLGSHAEAARAALDERPLNVVMNWRWSEGLSTSVQLGLAALPPETGAAILLQCDQPLLTADLLRAIVGRFEETGAVIVHPVHAGRRGTPTLFHRRLFPELAAVSGDQGGRALIATHADDVATVEVSDPDLLADIDTPADYERLKVSANLKPETAKPETVLSHIRHLIIDMDGVLWRGEEPLPGLQEFFGFLRQHDIEFMLATNNSSRPPEEYQAKLASFGVQVPLERILTSSLATAAYLATVAPAGTRVFPLGEEGIRSALEGQGFVLADEDVEYVVSGWDRQLTWNRLADAAFLIQGGAGFVGTNPDVTLPSERGLVPGSGVQLMALEMTSGVEPVVIGKPEPRMYEEALRRMGASPETTATIGDRLDTDIAGGVRAGLTTILVLSGIVTEPDLAASSVKPDLVFADTRELVRKWTEQLCS
jgi:4-nitrophenyl phosphatase